MITRLVVNGCSYMHHYSNGYGHRDLANELSISNVLSLALNGSCNSRIIRTTLKDSYQTSEKTFYVIGLTFLGRVELPVAKVINPFEGRWMSIQNTVDSGWWCNNSILSMHELSQFVDFKLKTEINSIADRLEQLMYQLLSMINDLISRGHQVLVFQNPSDIYDEYLNNNQFAQLTRCINIIDGLKWKAIPWQVTQGIKFNPRDKNLDINIRHPLPGEHKFLNKFLIDYINKNALQLSVL